MLLIKQHINLPLLKTCCLPMTCKIQSKLVHFFSRSPAVARTEITDNLVGVRDKVSDLGKGKHILTSKQSSTQHWSSSCHLLSIKHRHETERSTSDISLQELLFIFI